MLFILPKEKVSAQGKTIEDLKVALTLKLCEYVSWPNDTSKSFTLAVLSSNPKLVSTFLLLSSKYRIHNKPIFIKKVGFSLDFESQVLYVDESNSDFIPQYWNERTRKHTLLFSENYKSAKEIMFNILTKQSQGSITFELNRTNIIFEGLDIKPEIIELRGSEIDVRELYRQTKNRLDKEETKVGQLQSKVDSQLKNIEKQEQLIAKLSKSIESQNHFMMLQTDSIRAKEATLYDLTEKTRTQEKGIRLNLELIDFQKKRITQINDTLALQNKKLGQQLDTLNRLNQQVAGKQKELSEKESILAKKEDVLKSKNNLIYFQAAVLCLIFIIFFLIVRAYRINKAARELLSKQKEELELALRKLTDAQSQLVQAEKMASLGVLTAGIAHEINNPVNFINSGIQGLRKVNQNILKVLNGYRAKYKEQDEELTQMEKDVELPFLLESSQSMIKNIQVGVERTVNIIQSLRTFAHSDQETIKQTDIHKNIDLALTLLYNQYKYRVEIVKEYAELPSIPCYSGKINQVFMNILTNAIQAIPDKGIITIKTYEEDEFVVISIKDNGVGMEESTIKKIFDPFFTTKEVGQGTGMGLSIAFSIIEEHRGSIKVKSKQGEGSEFVVYLPINQNSIIQK
jgi:signal transduction histidine kinase